MLSLLAGSSSKPGALGKESSKFVLGEDQISQMYGSLYSRARRRKIAERTTEIVLSGWSKEAACSLLVYLY